MRCDGLLRTGNRCRAYDLERKVCMKHAVAQSWRVRQWEQQLSAADKQQMASLLDKLPLADKLALREVWVDGGAWFRNEDAGKRIMRQLTDTFAPTLLALAKFELYQLDAIWYKVWRDTPRSSVCKELDEKEPTQ